MDVKSHRGRKGRAPVASLEDLSDDSPPEEKSRLALPGIKESSAVADSSGRMTTPRIDISRASSSSHQEDSSPERELLTTGGDGGPPTKLGLGFTEEMAQELHSSTEELDFQDPDDQETKTRRKKLQSQHAVTKYDSEIQIEKDKERKDSACSEGFLFIGGRTSRLSSIGSAASGGSAASAVSGGSAISATSVASRLSAASNYSKASRCSSPHRMMLETSFCGPKPIPSLSIEAKDPESVILSREIDPADAVLPKLYAGKSKLEVKKSNPKSTTSETKHRHPKKPRTKKKPAEDALVKIIPLHGSVDEPESEEEGGVEEVAASGKRSPPEYGIYIPLKGPDPPGRGRDIRTNLDRKEEKEREITRTAQVEAFRKEDRDKAAGTTTTEIEESDLVQFISLHGDDDEDLRRKRKDQSQNRNGHNVQFKPWTEDDIYSVERRKARTPEPSMTGGKSGSKTTTTAPRKLDLANKHGARTPSPASSFRAVFRRSSDSTSSSKRSHQGSIEGSSRGGSKKDSSKNKSMFGSLFKKSSTSPRDNRGSSSSRQSAGSQRTTDIELKSISHSTRQQEKKSSEPDQIIIPLHSPDSIVEPVIVIEEAMAREKGKRDLETVTPSTSFINQSESIRSFGDQKVSMVPRRSRPSPTVSYKGGDFDNSTAPSGSGISGQQEAISDVAHTMAINVVVVDVIKEDNNIVAYNDMKRDKSVESVRSHQSNIRMRRDETKESIKSIEKAYASEESDLNGRRKSDSLGRDSQGMKSDASQNSLSKMSGSRKSSITSVKVVESFIQGPEDRSRSILQITVNANEISSVSIESCADMNGARIINTYDDSSPLAKENDESIAQGGPKSTTTTESSEITVIEAQIPIKGGVSDKRRDEEEEDEKDKSSGSERGEVALVEAVIGANTAVDERQSSTEDDTERKSLFHHGDSVEDELPYIPTTLPQERSVGVPILPIKQRVGEIKTYPIERPRSTTPIIPTCLDDYYTSHDESSTSSSSSGKMQIVLPRTDSMKGSKLKGNPKIKPWSLFAEECLQSPKEGRKTSDSDSPPPPPPLPPRGSTTPTGSSSKVTTPSWVCFDEVPERKRAPKRITTLPRTATAHHHSSSHQHHPHQSTSSHHQHQQPQPTNVVYSYVNPEECSCECHDTPKYCSQVNKH